MFEEILKTLRKLEGTTTYSSKIECDDEGYIDKECPNDKCLSKFKVKADDWGNLVSDEKVYCPYCGYVAPAKSWYTTEQVEEAKQQAIQNISNQLGEAIKKDAQKFNSQPKKGFISMSLKVTGWEKHPLLPIKALDLMEQKLKCSQCGCSYSVVGPSTFCPCCGYSSAENTFHNSIDTISSKLKVCKSLATFYKELSKDEVVAVQQSLLKSSLSELVGAFQVLCTSIFSQNHPLVRLKPNVFQRLEDGNKLWKDNANIEYQNWLSNGEMADLKKYFQQRHLLEHKNGIVDDDYIRKSGDTKYIAGQRLVINESDVSEFLAIIMKLGDGLISSQQNDN